MEVNEFIKKMEHTLNDITYMVGKAQGQLQYLRETYNARVQNYKVYSFPTDKVKKVVKEKGKDKKRSDLCSPLDNEC